MDKYGQEETFSHDTEHTMKPFIGSDVKPIPRIDIRPDDRAFLLKNFLTPDECKYYIEESEKIGYISVNFQKNYRTNTRCVVYSEEISQVLWERVKSHITPIIVTKDDFKQVGVGFKLEGTWKPVGVNPCWRFCKYLPGAHFGPHHDGPFIRSTEDRSMKTLNIYLNGGFQGGTTNFVNENQSKFVDSQGRVVAESKNVNYRVVPEDGLALIFNHHILHEGEPLQSDVKYIMRSDIMYVRENPPVVSEKESKALDLYYQANNLESNGLLKEAAVLYAQAAKIWPEIEYSQVAKQIQV